MLFNRGFAYDKLKMYENAIQVIFISKRIIHRQIILINKTHSFIIIEEFRKIYLIRYDNMQKFNEAI